MFEQLVGKLPVGIGVVNENFQVVYLNEFFLDRLPHELRGDYKEKWLPTYLKAKVSF